MTEEIKKRIESDLKGIIDDYNAEMEKLFSVTKGGSIRGKKGKLVEILAEKIVILTWTKVLEQPIGRLTPAPNKKKKAIKLKNVEQYIQRYDGLPIAEIIEAKKSTIKYDFGADLHVFIDKQLVLVIECKAYTESAMLKRLIYDRRILHEFAPNAQYVLLQLESAFSGDFHKCSESSFGSNQYHVFMSREESNIEIITLLEGKRDSNNPIHRRENKKELKKEHLIYAVEVLAKILEKHI